MPMQQPLMPIFARPTSRAIASQPLLRHFIRARSFSSAAPLRSSTTATTTSATTYRPSASTLTSKLLHIQPTFQTYRIRTMATQQIPDRYKLIFFVPHSHLDVCKDAVFATGAGTYPGGKYSKCCFQTPGTGQFLPGEGANPAIGSVGDVEHVEEMKVEIMCVGRTIMLQAVEALVKAHPYEQVAYEVYKMENV
ncbi:uncharacterized protein BP01DRAFT_358905, partial [Aspergillus saccharolyticus JOP 1030-1]